MYRFIGSASLRTGEQLDLGVVECPDSSWASQVKPLLGHKDRMIQDFFDAALDRPLDQLCTRFYLGSIAGQAVSNVMIVSGPGPDGDIGMLGHVYTRPEHRQKGAFRHVMAAQMLDCRRLGMAALTLGTGFETHPYWIYHSFGFRSIDGVSGKMWWFASQDPTSAGAWLQGGPADVRPMRWDDWPRMNMLAFQPDVAGEPLPRSWTFRVKGQGGAVEGMFQSLQRSAGRGAVVTGRVLSTAPGMAAGWAVLQPDDFTFGEGALLDLYVHPHFQDRVSDLLEGLALPSRVTAYTTDPDSYRARALTAAGFHPTATLPAWLTTASGPRDLHVYVRR